MYNVHVTRPAKGSHQAFSHTCPARLMFVLNKSTMPDHGDHGQRSAWYKQADSKGCTVELCESLESLLSAARQATIIMLRGAVPACELMLGGDDIKPKSSEMACQSTLLCDQSLIIVYSTAPIVALGYRAHGCRVGRTPHHSGQGG